MPININTTPGAQKYLMACGDSKTGISDGRWRIFMQDIFASENKRVTWIGNIDGIGRGDPVGMQGWHSGVGGAKIADIRALVAATTSTVTINGVVINTIPDPKYTLNGVSYTPNPDIITIWLGTNDLLNSVSEATMEADYTGFLDDIHTRWPLAKVVCVNIDQNYAGVSALIYNAATFNAFLAALPANPSYSSFVSYVNVATNLGFSTLYSDGLHPVHPNGDWLIAMDIWKQGIDPLI